LRGRRPSTSFYLLSPMWRVNIIYKVFLSWAVQACFREIFPSGSPLWLFFCRSPDPMTFLYAAIDGKLTRKHSAWFLLNVTFNHFPSMFFFGFSSLNKFSQLYAQKILFFVFPRHQVPHNSNETEALIKFLLATFSLVRWTEGTEKYFLLLLRCCFWKKFFFHLLLVIYITTIHSECKR
jgi:hypothetical protein